MRREKRKVKDKKKEKKKSLHQTFLLCLHGSYPSLFPEKRLFTSFLYCYTHPETENEALKNDKFKYSSDLIV